MRQGDLLWYSGAGWPKDKPQQLNTLLRMHEWATHRERLMENAALLGKTHFHHHGQRWFLPFSLFFLLFLVFPSSETCSHMLIRALELHTIHHQASRSVDMYRKRYGVGFPHVISICGWCEEFRPTNHPLDIPHGPFWNVRYYTALVCTSSRLFECILYYNSIYCGANDRFIYVQFVELAFT